MADEEKKTKAPVYFPSIPPKAPLSTQSYSKSVQEAPYRALIGVVIDARQPERHTESPRCRIRRQTGLTNRWRLPESLYSDLLGSSQALKSINMPFNQSLVSIITGRYPTCNGALNTCKEYSLVNKNKWSFLISKDISKSKTKVDNSSEYDGDSISVHSKSQLFSKMRLH